jgi:hypothetical protein
MFKADYQEMLSIYKEDENKYTLALNEELRRIFEGFVVSSTNGSSTGNSAIAKVKSTFYKKTYPIKVYVKHGPANLESICDGLADAINHIDHYKCASEPNPHSGDRKWNGYDSTIWKRMDEHFIREAKARGLSVYSISRGEFVQMALEGSPYMESVQALITALNTSDKVNTKRAKYRVKVSSEKIRPLMRELLENGLSQEDIIEMLKEELVRTIQGN